jgi:valyl-tRNA synthetase
LAVYRFAEAYDVLYHLLWDDFADWYIEVSKLQPNASMLAYGLETILKLAHPYAPFVTETIWQTLSGEGDDRLLITSSWPEASNDKTPKVSEFEELKAIVEEIRFIQASLRRRNFNLYHTEDDFIATHTELIKALTKLDSVTSVKDGTGLYLTATKRRVWLDIDAQTAKDFLKQLEARHKDQSTIVQQLKARLSNKSYVQNAPMEIVAQSRKQLETAETLLSKLEAEFNRFSGN